MFIRLPISAIRYASRSLFGGGHFLFNGKWLQYLDHPRTFNNERRIEIPIILSLLDLEKPTLEVGNVLSRFIHGDWVIVDKYEKGLGVTNEDIVDYSPGRLFEQIFSISTIEHIGWDYPEERSNDKIQRALEHMRHLLAPGGTMIVTVPIGYNHLMDDLLRRRQDLLGNVYWLKQTMRDVWAETNAPDALDAHYGRPFRFANAIAVGVYNKHDD